MSDLQVEIHNHGSWGRHLTITVPADRLEAERHSAAKRLANSKGELAAQGSPFPATPPEIITADELWRKELAENVFLPGVKSRNMLTDAEFADITAHLLEVLLRQRELATGYRFFVSGGISYRFGSIFNNVVNPRFTGTDMFF